MSPEPKREKGARARFAHGDGSQRKARRALGDDEEEARSQKTPPPTVIGSARRRHWNCAAASR